MGNRCNRHSLGLSTPVVRVAKTLLATVRVERAAEDTSTSNSSESRGNEQLTAGGERI